MMILEIWDLVNPCDSSVETIVSRYDVVVVNGNFLQVLTARSSDNPQELMRYDTTGDDEDEEGEVSGSMEDEQSCSAYGRGN